MKCTDWFIDSDTHITEPGDVWTSRLPRKFRDAAPHMVRTDDGVDVWRFGKTERMIPVGATAVAISVAMGSAGTTLRTVSGSISSRPGTWRWQLPLRTGNCGASVR